MSRKRLESGVKSTSPLFLLRCGTDSSAAQKRLLQGRPREWMN
jgi:hypothetical protein